MPSDGPIPFRAFSELDEVRVYDYGILPHWRQDGCTYFVTFRAADSLPQSVLAELDEDRLVWLKRHGIDGTDPDWRSHLRTLPASDQRAYEKDVGQKLNEALDLGYGECVLKQSELARIVLDACAYFDPERLRCRNVVVIPNHVHALILPNPGFELEDLLHSIKSFTANQIQKRLHQSGAFWQRESYDHIVRDSEQLRGFQSYIRQNPEKANLKDGEFLLREAEFDFS